MGDGALIPMLGRPSVELSPIRVGTVALCSKQGANAFARLRTTKWEDIA